MVLLSFLAVLFEMSRLAAIKTRFACTIPNRSLASDNVLALSSAALILGALVASFPDWVLNMSKATTISPVASSLLQGLWVPELGWASPPPLVRFEASLCELCVVGDLAIIVVMSDPPAL